MNTVTVDTNCINAKGMDQALNSLEDLERQGIVQLRKTDALDTDLVDDEGASAEKRRQKSARLPEDMGIWILGYSRLNHTRLAGEDDGPAVDRLSHLLFSESLSALAKKSRHRQVRDVMHLYTHIMHKRDYFVTRDHDFLDHADTIRKEYGTRVGTPGQCIASIQTMESQGVQLRE